MYEKRVGKQLERDNDYKLMFTRRTNDSSINN
jgi:hypothetical protein